MSKEKQQLATYIGMKVRLLRTERGLTQVELGRRMGSHQVAISQIECGARLPAWGFLLRVAKACNATLLSPSFELNN